jgi:hypothetical protein
MGRKARTAVTGVGQPHEKGARIAVVQLLLHQPLGMIGYPLPIYWANHVNFAHAGYERLLALHEQIEAIEPWESGVRHVSDEALLIDVYDSGSAMVSNAVRSVQHLAQQMSAFAKVRLTSTTLVDRIKEAGDLVGIDARVGSDGWQGFTEIVRVRDAIEHPETETVYSGEETGQESVPLAWLISDQGLTAYVRYRGWFDDLARDWKGLLAAQGPATLTVQRGLVSKHAVKKPPRSSRRRGGL